MNYRCPVCFYAQLPYPPEDFHICPCCGTEFGNDDVTFGYEELRNNWLRNGARWFFRNPPPDWSAWQQLAAMSYGVRTTSVARDDVPVLVNKGMILAPGFPQFRLA